MHREWHGGATARILSRSLHSKDNIFCLATEQTLRGIPTCCVAGGEPLVAASRRWHIRWIGAAMRACCGCLLREPPRGPASEAYFHTMHSLAWVQHASE